MHPPPHIRVTYSGRLGSTALPFEIWSMGIALGNPPVGSPQLNRDGLKALATAIRPAFLAFLGAVSTTVSLQRVRCASVGSNGKVLLDAGGAYLQGDDETVTQIAGSNAPHAPQVTVAVSLLTGAAGPTGKGRVFIPHPTASTSDGRLSPTAQTSIREAALTWIRNTNTASTNAGAGVVSLASAGSLLRGVDPSIRSITQVGVGRVFDTQRRRRGALKEEKVFAAV